ncbi:HAMP domain-containing sensor histidine kinase [Actinomycetes bacterium KLBMP 9759]
MTDRRLLDLSGWPLRRRLVVSIATVVGIVLAAVGAIGVATVNDSVTQVVDGQLTGSMDGLCNSVEKFRHSAAEDGTADRAGPKGFKKPLVAFVGHGPGTVIAVVQNGQVIDSALFTDLDAQPLPAETAAPLGAIGAPAAAHDVELPGLGSYRVSAKQFGQVLLVAGVSLEVAETAVWKEVIVFAVLAVLAIGCTVAALITIVRVALRPLDRVARTASEVTHLALDQGDAPTTPRVGAGDTDPRTEVGKVGEALNRLLNHVDDALATRMRRDQRMRRFVTDASHELRTPLAVIHGYAELTRQESDQLPDMTEYALSRIESETKRLSTLVGDLLLLARIDEGQDVHVEEVDLAEVAVAAVHDAQASAAGHLLGVSVPDSPAAVVGDPVRLHQVVLNLLTNAGQHTPAGTQVGCTVRHTGERVELVVSDDGPGIPEDLMPVLFQRFAHGSSPGHRSFGLGLAIVASIVDAHGGTIDVDSSPAGTSFRVVFPAAVQRAAPEAERVSAGPDVSPDHVHS